MAPLWRLASEVLSAPEPHLGALEFVVSLQWDRVAVEAFTEAYPGLSAHNVITISYSSSVIELIERARPKTVICMRSEPGGEGARAAEAMSRWTNVLVMEDEDAITNVPGDAVIVGADAVTPHAVINKVKTRGLTKAASVRKVPTYAVAGESKFIGEELPVADPFEATPLELFVGVAGADGILDPQAAGERARARPIHRSLRRLLDELRKSRG